MLMLVISCDKLYKMLIIREIRFGVYKNSVLSLHSSPKTEVYQNHF